MHTSCIMNLEALMNKKTVIPKYFSLMEELKNDIIKGNIQPNEKLPSENELSKKYNISRHTVRKALAMLENEGYIAPEHGRGTFCIDRKKAIGPMNSKNIAVITTYISDYIFPRVIAGIDEVLTESGYSIILKNTGNSQKKESKVLEDIMTKNIDGLIIEPSKSEVFCKNLKQYQMFDNMNIPYVFIQGTYMQLKNKPSILLDDTKGMYLLTKHLTELGHKNIAGIFKVDDYQGNARHKGYVKALQEAKIDYNPDIVIWFHTEDRDKKPAAATRELIENNVPIDAIVCYNDEVALEIYEELELLGISVPEQISITGYDNSFISENGPIKLTTISHPKEELGRLAAKLLLEKINKVTKEDSAVKRLIQPELIIRESCIKRR